MPELPEVETIVRGLRSAVLGLRIVRVELRRPGIALAPAGRSFEERLTGERIAGVRRRGKYAVLELGSGCALVISLRMTGRLVVQRPGEPDYPHTHALFALEDGRRLSFADSRRFGRLRLVEPGEAWDAWLGIEPLSGDFTPQRFAAMLAGRTTPIKTVLLDQRRLAGIGNIYACEALWEARIRPNTPAGRLSAPAIRRLREAIVDVLRRATELRGSSVDDYVDAEGLRGGFQNVLSVYGRHGRPCPRCGRPIVRTLLAQRGTWWCRSCQRERPGSRVRRRGKK
jgi:formamidopyrimidine-DNA glycosylase